MRKLTPAILRAAADHLAPLALGKTSPDREFMCRALGHVADENLSDYCGGKAPARYEFEDLIDSHGVPMGGKLLEETGADYPYAADDPRAAEVMSIRFMFLEFLALDMETSK